jgi:2-octaprenyl-6-methoxyphenol hydroxylase
MSKRFAVAVVGGGPAGLAAALAAAAAGAETALFAARDSKSPAADNRTAALFAGSIEFLQNVGAWERLQPASARITAIRIIDDQGALLRAPEVLFSAEDIDRDGFGWNVPNAALTGSLTECADAATRLSRVETQGISDIAIRPDCVTLTSHEGATFEAQLVVGADGRNSLCRTAAGIDTQSWRYEQAALTTSFFHARPHHDVSTEFHRPAGPLTTVPLPGSVSSLVWVERPAEAQRLAALDEARFRAELEARLQGLLGTLGEIRPRSVFPLSGLSARTFGQKRIALAGEAAHVIPPIGAQGLNLGLRDAAVLADCIADARAAGRDPGDDATLEAYSRLRQGDVSSRITAVDILNRSLISGILPVQFARGLGLIALKTMPALRRQAIREGLQPSSLNASLLAPGGAGLLAQRSLPPSRHSAA